MTTVYKNNVLKFQDGRMGAVNGMRPNGQVCQFREFRELVLLLYNKQ